MNQHFDGGGDTLGHPPLYPGIPPGGGVGRSRSCCWKEWIPEDPGSKVPKGAPGGGTPSRRVGGYPPKAAGPKGNGTGERDACYPMLWFAIAELVQERSACPRLDGLCGSGSSQAAPPSCRT